MRDLGVRIVTPSRDQHVTKRVSGLTFEASDPGGATTCSFTLRMARGDWPDIVGAHLFVYDAGTCQALWDGWIDNPGEAFAAAETFEVSAQGPATLADRLSRALWYIDTGYDNFRDNYVWVGEGSTRITGASESVADLPSAAASEEDEDAEIPAAVVAAMSSNTIVGTGHFCGMRWMGGDGTEMKARAYSFRTQAGISDNNYRLRVAGWGGNNDRNASTAFGTQQAVTARAFARPALYFRRHSGGAATIPNDNYWGAFTDPLIKAELVDRFGDPVVPTLDRFWPVTAIVEDLIGRMLPDIDPRNSTVEDTTYEIDQLLYLDGTRASAVLTDMIAFEPDFSWRIDTIGSSTQGRGFHWYNRAAQAVRYEISEADGVEFPGGDTAVATEAIVFWTDPKSGFDARRRTIKTADELSEAWAHAGGRTLTADPVTLDEGRGSAANAARAAQMVLTSHEAPHRSGTATVARPVRDLITGEQVPPRRLRAGELVRVRETDEVLPVTAFSYDADSDSAALTIGWPETELEDLLADIPTT